LLESVVLNSSNLVIAGTVELTEGNVLVSQAALSVLGNLNLSLGNSTCSISLSLTSSIDIVV